MLYAHNYCDDCIYRMTIPQQETHKQTKMEKNDR
jgi:hypothetical protein